MLRRAALALCLFTVALVLSAAAARANGPAVVFNELLIGNATTIDPQYTEYAAWIELRNNSAAAVNLIGYRLLSLPDGADEPDSYTLPKQAVVPANGYLLIWADEQGLGLHTSFELDMDGGELTLVAPDSSLVDTFAFAEQEPDVSFGRTPDGGSAWAFYDRPTPGAANATTPFAPEPGGELPAQTDAPVITPDAGFYPDAQLVTITAGPAATIRYTTDGSRPHEASPVYTAPFLVNATGVVRARAWVDGELASRAATSSLFIGYDTDLAVVSIATRPANFFDNRIGIYVAGTNGVTGPCSRAKRANWNQSWERPVSIELFETDGQRGFQQDAGIEIHGNCTRADPQKSLEIKTRKLYGDNDIDYMVFPDNPLDEYRRLLLRAGGNNQAQHAVFREPMAQLLGAATMAYDHQQYRPAVVFINGQYWGIYGIRDKGDEALVEQNYDLDEDEYDFFEGNRSLVAGDTAALDALYQAIRLNLTVPANYEAVMAQLDAENFMDYFIAQFYVGNKPWPGGNIRYWRERSPDGVWRYIVFDMDGGLMRKQANRNTFQSTLNQNHFTIQPLNRLLVNPTFRAMFMQRFASHIAITYDTARVNAFIDANRDTLADEMPNHIARWQRPWTLAKWHEAIEEVRQFAAIRPGAVRRHLDKYLGNPGLAGLTVDVSVAGGGQVEVAGVAPFAYPFTAPYFRQLPLTLRAVPAPGFAFVRWEPSGETTPAIALTLTGPASRTAVFEAEPLPLLVINEIHYHPADPQTEAGEEFVEIFNADTATVDLSGFSIDGLAFTFPDGATIDPGEYIVVVADSASPAFSALPADAVFDFAWEDPEKLSNGGEELVLRDGDGNPVDSVAYEDGDLWPAAPDEGGPSLALLSPELDNSEPGSWAPSAEAGGTPGAVNFP